MLREREVGGVGTGSRCERVCEPSRRHHLHLGQLGVREARVEFIAGGRIGNQVRHARLEGARVVSSGAFDEDFDITTIGCRKRRPAHRDHQPVQRAQQEGLFGLPLGEPRALLEPLGRDDGDAHVDGHVVLVGCDAIRHQMRHLAREGAVQPAAQLLDELLERRAGRRVDAGGADDYGVHWHGGGGDVAHVLHLLRSRLTPIPKRCVRCRRLSSSPSWLALFCRRGVKMLHFALFLLRILT